jgi:hypothetical protein
MQDAPRQRKSVLPAGLQPIPSTHSTYESFNSAAVHAYSQTLPSDDLWWSLQAVLREHDEAHPVQVRLIYLNHLHQLTKNL